MSKICTLIYQFCFFLSRIRLGILGNVINKTFIRLLLGADIGTGAKIGRGVTFEHGGLGIVIHKRAIIGDGTQIFSGVTIGGRSEFHGVPNIGKNVIIGTGAKVLGPVVIGDNAKIGANAVVLIDVPSNSTAVGIPAEIFEHNLINGTRFTK